MSTKWPHLVGVTGEEAADSLRNEGYEPRVFRPFMCGLSRSDVDNPKFVEVHVDADNKVTHLSK